MIISAASGSKIGVMLLHQLPKGPAHTGQELQQQVAQLQAEYSRVGDQLESEQTRIMQVLTS